MPELVCPRCKPGSTTLTNVITCIAQGQSKVANPNPPGGTLDMPAIDTDKMRFPYFGKGRSKNLMGAGFVPVAARQARTRRGSPMHARHVVRLRRRFETVQLRDAVPEIVFLNSHDGTSAYQLRMGVFRVVCLNGLIVSQGAFPAYRVSHRGDVVDEVVSGALEVSERFGSLADQVERMERRSMPNDEQIRFAERALAIRYPETAQSGLQPSQLLTCRRVQDTGDDLWSVFNRVQENLLSGGLSRRSASGRLTRTRRITSIRQDVKLNGALWDMAREALAA